MLGTLSEDFLSVPHNILVSMPPFLHPHANTQRKLITRKTDIEK